MTQTNQMQTASGRRSAGDIQGAPKAKRTDDWKAGIREIVATLMAVTILALATWMLSLTYLTAGKVKEDLAASPEIMQLHERAYTRQKDIMIYVFGLLGTVLGYYFGRVPAERRAERAENAAEQAQDNTSAAVRVADRAKEEARIKSQGKDVVDKKLLDVKETLKRIQEGVEPGRSGGRLALGAEATDDAPSADRTYMEIDALLQRLN